MVTPLHDRNNPRRGTASESQYSLFEFMHDFGDDAACLEYLWRERYSEDGEHAFCDKCQQVRSFRRYHTSQQRQSWTCTACGHHVHPTAGTIFEKSSTSLHLWFYGIYLMTSTRCGISAKQFERETGVTYKTAWRMFHQIRKMLAEDVTNLSGTVEIDETYVGGKPRYVPGLSRSEIVSRAIASKVQVMGMVERGGRVRADVRPRSPLLSNVVEHVMPDALVYSDEAACYWKLGKKGYAHSRVHHSMRVYVSGDVHTNTIEGFWSLVKRGISGAYHSVSAKYLQMYFDEYTFRYNHREENMFALVVRKAASRA
jgi:transposase